MSGAVGRLRENLVKVVSTLVTGVWMVGLFTGQDWWLAALLFGYVAVVPVAKILAGEHEYEERETREGREESATESTDEALATLRERYAGGELAEAQFERKLERLLEVETVEDASRYHDSGLSGNTSGSGPTSIAGREREPEPE